MNVAAGGQETAQPRAASTPSGRALRLTTVTHAEASGGVTEKNCRQHALARSLRRVALVYTVAGLAFAGVLAVAWQVSDGQRILPIRSLVLTVVFAWPLVLALEQLVALGWRDRLVLVAIYLVAALVATLLAWPGDVRATFYALASLWLFMNAPVTVLLVAFLSRRVRAVGPLVLVFLVTGIAGALLLPMAVANNEKALDIVVPVFAFLGIGGRELFFLFGLLGFLALGLLGWALLRLIGRRYRQKRMSDQSLALDAMWLLFAVINSTWLASAGWAWFLAGPAAFVLYKLVVGPGLARFVRPAAASAQAPTLLLLRVFSLGSRSFRLFDALSGRWLRVGAISLIAGPDLVTGTVEPHEFLDFVGGRLSRQFVQGQDDLAGRLADLDERPDPDGRHRVNEFFCRADTWQMTMQQLAARSDAVLMDLRSFSPTNQGCLFELGQLLNIVPLPQVLLIVDRTTDRGFLASALQNLWRSVPADSPNRKLVDPEVKLFEALGARTGAEARALLDLLLAQPAADFGA